MPVAMATRPLPSPPPVWNLRDELAGALSLWRTSRHPELPAVIDALSTLVCHGVEPPPGGRNGAAHRAWLEREARGASDDYEGLLKTVVSLHLPPADRPVLSQAVDRLRRLVLRGPDPRLAAAVLEWLRATVYFDPVLAPDWVRPAWWRAVDTVLCRDLPYDFDWTHLADEVATGADPTVDPQTLRHRTWWLSRRLSRAPAPRWLTEDEQAGLDRWLVGLGRRRPVVHRRQHADEREWIEVITRDPDDGSVRRVFADWLLQQGESTRAAFLRQEIADHDQAQFTPVERQRMTIGWRNRYEPRFERSFPTWFGPRFTTMVRTWNVLGFPRAAALTRNLHLLDEAQQDRGWRTLRGLELRLDSRYPASVVRLLSSSVLANLQHLSGVPSTVLRSLGRPPFALHSLGVRIFGDGDGLGTVLGEYPTLRRLSVELERPGMPSLAGVAVPEVRVRRSGLLRSPEAMAAIAQAVGPEVERLVLAAPRGALTLRRDGAGWVPELRSAVWPFDWLTHTHVGMLQTWLGGLPDSLGESTCTVWWSQAAVLHDIGDRLVEGTLDLVTEPLDAPGPHALPPARRLVLPLHANPAWVRAAQTWTHIDEVVLHGGYYNRDTLTLTRGADGRLAAATLHGDWQDRVGEKLEPVLESLRQVTYRPRSTRRRLVERFEAWGRHHRVTARVEGWSPSD